MVVTFYRRHSGFHSPNAFFAPKRSCLFLVRQPLSANERIAEFLDFAIQDKFAYVNKLERPQAAFYMGNCSKFSRVRRRWSFFTNVGGSGSGLRPLFTRLKFENPLKEFLSASARRAFHAGTRSVSAAPAGRTSLRAAADDTDRR